MTTGPLEDHDLEVGTARLAAALEDGSATVVDVREPREWEGGRIPGVRHIPLDRLAEQAGEIDASRPVIFQCLVGNRSLMAAQAFRRAGFEAYSLAGGITTWAAEGRPLEPDGAVIVGH